MRDTDSPCCPSGCGRLKRLGAKLRKGRNERNDWDALAYVAYLCPVCNAAWYDRLDGSPLEAEPRSKGK